jgi:hypothetical protein
MHGKGRRTGQAKRLTKTEKRAAAAFKWHAATHRQGKHFKSLTGRFKGSVSAESNYLTTFCNYSATI